MYNVTPGAATLAQRYAPVTALAELRALVVDCRVLARMAEASEKRPPSR